MSDRDELIARARERAETATPSPPAWGYPILTDEHETFVGRWLEPTEDPDNGRAAYLFLDEGDEPCFMRSYASFEREVDRVQPRLGDTVVIHRAANFESEFDRREGREPTGRTFGMEKEPNPAPLPGGTEQPDAELF